MADVELEREGTTAVLTLNRPDLYNAIGGELLGCLLDLAEAADDDDSVRAIVTTGAGSAYCAGGDMAGLTQNGAAAQIDLGTLGTKSIGGRTGVDLSTVDQIRDDPLGIGRWAQRFLRLGTPTIAAVNGATAGGGFGVMMLHDVRIMSRRARIVPAFASLGVSPELGLTWLLPRIVGLPAAFEILARSTPIDADEALEFGLVNEVVEPGELREAALARANQFEGSRSQSVRAIKRLLLSSLGSNLDTQLEREWTAQGNLFRDPRTQAAIQAVQANMGKARGASGKSQG